MSGDKSIEKRLCPTSLSNVRVCVDDQAQTRCFLQHMHQIFHDDEDHFPVMQAGYARTSFGTYQVNWESVTTDTKHRQL